MADRHTAGDDRGVPIVSSLHYLMGPLVSMAAMGVIILICRWVFSTDERDARTAKRLEKALSSRDYGLLVPVAEAPTRDDAEMLRDLLQEAGVRASISPELEVLVFASDADRARQLVS